MPPNLSSRRRQYGRYVIAASIVLVCGVGAVWLFTNNRKSAATTRAPSPSTPTHVVTQSAAAPSDNAVTATTFHSSATGDQPSYIKLPSLHAEGYIQNVGIDQQGAVAAPTNVHLAGWYVNSLPPGQPGLSIIDGHVDGTKSPGIFYRLDKLAAGDAIEVDLANGQKKSFTVRGVQRLPVADAAAALFARNYQFASQLNLITCGGAWDGKAHAYTDRIVVTASLAR